MDCKQYPKDYMQHFKYSFRYLNLANVKFFGIENTWWQKNWKFFYLLPISTFQFVTMCIYIYNLLSRVQIFEMAYLMPAFLVTIQGFIKVAVMLPNRTKIAGIIDDLGQMWRVEKLSNTQMEEKSSILNKMNFCVKVSYWISVSGASQYMLSPLFETVVRRFILHQDCDMLLPLSSVYPFDPCSNWVVYLAVYAFQCYNMSFIVFFYNGADFILINLCALLGSEFVLIREDLKYIKPISNVEIKSITNKGTKIDRITIYDVVKKHQKLIKTCQQLDEVFNPMIFFDLLFVGITTCFFRYAAQFSRGPTYMLNNYVAVFASLLQVLILCYYGELISGASVDIADAAYENPWYKGGTEYKKAIWFIIKRSQIPCVLTSMRYAPVTLNMFTKVISTTWSYVSLMSTVYDAD